MFDRLFFLRVTESTQSNLLQLSVNEEVNSPQMESVECDVEKRNDCEDDRHTVHESERDYDTDAGYIWVGYDCVACFEAVNRRTLTHVG